MHKYIVFFMTLTYIQIIPSSFVQRNTFQAVLAQDVNQRAVVMFNYGDMEWTKCKTGGVVGVAFHLNFFYKIKLSLEISGKCSGSVSDHCN